MQDIETNKIFFEIFLLVWSSTLYIIAFVFFYKYLIQERKCTSQVIGKVKRYTLATRGGENSSICLPVVYYQINGKTYKVVGPEYRGYVFMTKSTPNSKNEVTCHEENGKLIVNINKNSFIGIMKNPMEKLYPIDSEVNVYYCPENPRISYVMRYCNKKMAFYLTTIAASLILIIDIVSLIFL